MTLDMCSEKEEGKAERGQENAPRKATLEYRVHLPFLYPFMISFMEPTCKIPKRPWQGFSEEFG